MAKPVSPERLVEFDRMRRRLAYAFLALLLLILVGTLVYLWIGASQEGGTVVNALYMTVITVTTVGYEEVIDLTGSPGGRLFTVVLIIVGMGILTYAVALLAAFLIEGHFLNVFARLRMQKTIDEMNGHYIVCGCTPAAIHVAEELKKTARDLVLVADTPEGLDAMVRQVEDLPGVVGDPADATVLRRAGIDRAAGVVACLAGDKDNVIVTLTAHQLAPSARIIASVENAENEPKLMAAGASKVVSPSRIGGLRMASELVRPTVVSFLDKMLRVQTGTVESLRVEEVTVPEGSSREGMTLKELDITETTGAVLLATVRPESRKGSEDTQYEFSPPSSRPLEAGMTLLVMATSEMLAKLEARLR